MMSLSILWTLLCLATVKARSEVSIAEAALDTENTWSGVHVPEDEDVARKADVHSQNNADLEEAILSRIGLDALTHSMGSSKLEDEDGVNLGIALDEKLDDISDKIHRINGRESDIETDTNDNHLDSAGLRTLVHPGDVSSNHQENLRSGNVWSLIDGTDDVSRSDPNRNGRLNVLSTNRYNLNPVSALHRSAKVLPLVNGRGYNKWNINERDATSYNDPNADNDVLLLRLAALDGAKESKSNDLTNLLLKKNTGQHVVSGNNDLLSVSKNGAGVWRNIVGRQGLGKNDLENVKITSDQGKALINEIIGNKKSLVDPRRVNKNDKRLNLLSKIALNNLASNALDVKSGNRDVDSELANIIQHVRASRDESLNDGSNQVNVLDHVSRHGLQLKRKGVKKVSLNDLNEAKIALHELESNGLLSKTGSKDVDRELASIIVNARSGRSRLNDYDTLSTLEDDSNDVNVLDHLSKHGLRNNRKEVTRVSLNELNEAKRLLGPLSLDKVVTAGRTSNEVDGALLNALNTEDDLNALGALAVLSKAAEAEVNEKLNTDGLVHSIGQSELDVGSNLLSKFAASEDGEVNGVTSNNPLQKALNSLLVLSRVDATNNVESDLNSELHPDSLSRSHTDLLHNLGGSKSDTWLENKIAESEVDGVDNLLSSISRWGKKKLRKVGLKNKLRRPYRPHKVYRPRQNKAPRYLYQPKLSTVLNEDDNLSDLIALSRIAKLNDISNNIASVRNGKNQYNLDDLLSTHFDRSGVSDVSNSLDTEDLKNLIAFRNHVKAQVHAKDHLEHLSDVDEEKSVHSISNLDKEVRDAKKLLLAASVGNLKDQRRKLSGKSNLKLLNGEEETKSDNVVLVPVKVDSSAPLNRAGWPYDLSDWIDMGNIY